MIELNSRNYACARSNSAKKMTQCHFDVDYDRLSSDIQRLEELLQENQLDSGDKRIVSEAIWVLKKWLEKPTVQICFNFNEVNELENNADETVV